VIRLLMSVLNLVKFAAQEGQKIITEKIIKS